MPATVSAITMLAPATVRERNRRSGMSGFSIRAWRDDERGEQHERDGAEPSVRTSTQPTSEMPRIA